MSGATHELPRSRPAMVAAAAVELTRMARSAVGTNGADMALGLEQLLRNTMAQAKRSHDGPTLERLQKLQDGDLEVGDDKQGNKQLTIHGSPLARMFRDKRLDGVQFTALNRFHAHWWNGGLSESIRGVDLNRIYAPDPFSSAGMCTSEKQYYNRKEYRAAYALLAPIEGILVTNLVCSETLSLEQCGYQLGYSSPFRARAAAAKILRSIADRFAKLWGIS